MGLIAHQDLPLLRSASIRTELERGAYLRTKVASAAIELRGAFLGNRPEN
ncbi:hypothetical protein FHT85_004665 [Rhizobium sp. BK312]|nr:hypothetical protein [Rhizobium sp. BK312]MBB3427663.1 hypothetical protein [Rhizobium sp. BK312]